MVRVTWSRAARSNINFFLIDVFIKNKKKNFFKLFYAGGGGGFGNWNSRLNWLLFVVFVIKYIIFCSRMTTIHYPVTYNGDVFNSISSLLKYTRENLRNNPKESFFKYCNDGPWRVYKTFCNHLSKKHPNYTTRYNELKDMYKVTIDLLTQICKNNCNV